MPWLARGLEKGVVTSPYPKRRDGYAANFRATLEVISGGGGTRAERAASACPTRAITTADGTVRLDRGRCILCGRCTELAPQTFTFSPSSKPR